MESYSYNGCLLWKAEVIMWKVIGVILLLLAAVSSYKTDTYKFSSVMKDPPFTIVQNELQEDWAGNQTVYVVLHNNTKENLKSVKVTAELYAENGAKVSDLNLYAENIRVNQNFVLSRLVLDNNVESYRLISAEYERK